MNDTAQTIDVPERVATGRALIEGTDTHRPRFDRYTQAVGRAMLGVPDQVWRDAVALLEAQQLEFISGTLTHPYSVEALAGAQAPAEHLDAVRAILADTEDAEPDAVARALADVLHAAEADGYDPEDLYTPRSTTRMQLSRAGEAMDLTPLCEIGDQLTAAGWGVAADAADPHANPYSVVVEQLPETGRAIIRDLYASDPVTAEVTAKYLAEVLTRLGHQVERVDAGWDGFAVTVIVR
ncbi:hypothetical protein ACOQFV_24465 [Nocardiopsis changdeensis]|uniref:Uncharacterized protein n=1 Tax=Nocardiopsis changdeensis TaxID=2831969 RepID=A0A975QCM7_9ACTN|nr:MULTISPECIES: hypothetical protein [Nocardiopsis]QUX26455.1 hypothetical protein KGD84_32675 [Nocardiopsis changdeensis]QYX40727.1 hypothetical protein K1J57_32525 [Nocardiopsis sp. MT53]